MKIVRLDEDLPVGSDQMIGIELKNGTHRTVLHKVQRLDESDAEDSGALPHTTDNSRTYLRVL